MDVLEVSSFMAVAVPIFFIGFLEDKATRSSLPLNHNKTKNQNGADIWFDIDKQMPNLIRNRHRAST